MGYKGTRVSLFYRGNCQGDCVCVLSYMYYIVLSYIILSFLSLYEIKRTIHLLSRTPKTWHFGCEAKKALQLQACQYSSPCSQDTLWVMK